MTIHSSAGVDIPYSVSLFVPSLVNVVIIRLNLSEVAYQDDVVYT